MPHAHPPTLTILLAVALLAACGEDAAPLEPEDTRCEAPPLVRTTAAGVDFVRTPDACFAALPDWPYAPRYVELDGLRQAYVEEGPEDGPVVLLLHGQPSWSYLYRKMIPVLAEAGYRVIAMDHLGMGRSDKPVDIGAYSYLGHGARLLGFMDALALEDIHLFVQDWGSLVGLRVAGLNPERFARIAVGNGALPVVPAGTELIAPIEDPDTPAALMSPFAAVPEQQVPFYEGEDGCDPRFPAGDFSEGFGTWATYAMRGEDFRPSEVLEALTWFPLPDDEELAYDAPYPSRSYMAGVRSFPSLVNELGGANEEAWAGLTSFTRPFYTIWGANDAGNQGSCEAQQIFVDNVPGARGVPHTRVPEAGHFLQDDQGAFIAEQLVAFFGFRPLRATPPPFRYCEILLVNGGPEGVAADVWGTQNVSECPAESWDALDPDEVAAESGALAALFNGPRIWLAPGVFGEATAFPSPERRTFGDLEMRLLASLSLDPSQLDPTAGSTPYTESDVRRNTVFRFEAGAEIYELEAPGGMRYVMQSLSQIVDAERALEDLPTLGARLSLPEGWTYRARVLDEALTLVADGLAVVIQDELTNTYQRL